MPVVPAYCSRCDAIFGPKGAIAIEGVEQNLNILGDETSCAHCGSEAVILHGIYEKIGDAIRILTAPNCTADELERLASLLQEARRSGLDHGAFAARMKDELPQLSHALLALIPESSQHFSAYVSLLLYVDFDVLSLDHAREIPVDVNITPYITVIIDKMVSSKPWQLPEAEV